MLRIPTAAPRTGAIPVPVAGSWERVSALPSPTHLPVLLKEVVEWIGARPGACLVDGTLGLGGHAEALLEAIAPNGRLLAIDRDPRALEVARRRLSRFGPSLVPVHADHGDLLDLARREGFDAVDGLLLDLGVSSLQLDDPGRGFSFRHDGPLDMRMDTTAGITAADLIATASVEELRSILRDYGEERRAGAIARAIVRRRTEQPITRTRDLAELVADVLGPAARRYRIHPATRSFQALRIAVNGEVVALERLVEDAVTLLGPGGRAIVIAYHSLEDRAVKKTFRRLANRCTCPPRLPVCGCGREDLVRLMTRSPLRPTDAEIAANPRSRSARMRVAERL